MHRSPRPFAAVTIAALVALALPCLTLAACEQAPPVVHIGQTNGPADPAAAGEVDLVMKTYAVPGGYAQQLKSVLSSAFYGVRDKVGARAVVAPDGQLVVVGPPGLHEGVGALLASFKDKPAATPPPTFAVRTWMVLGAPATDPGAATRSGALGPVKGALDALDGAQGTMDYWLLERIDVQVLGDDHAQVHGRWCQAAVRASQWDERLLIDVKLKAGRSELETRLSTRRGDQIVLGEAGVDLRGFEGHPVPAEREGPVTLFYIVQADLQGAG